MSLQQYITAINEQLATHNMSIMICVAKKLYWKGWSVDEVVMGFKQLHKIKKEDNGN